MEYLPRSILLPHNSEKSPAPMATAAESRMRFGIALVGFVDPRHFDGNCAQLEDKVNLFM